jgi:hypothetical protein
VSGRARSRLLQASHFYLDRAQATRPPLPPATSDLPGHMALLNQAVAEGVSEHRRAILLAAVTRVARIGLEVDRLIIAARENLSREMMRRSLRYVSSSVKPAGRIGAMLHRSISDILHQCRVRRDPAPRHSIINP